MWIIEPPSSTIRRASAAYSSGVYGIAGHWSRFATAPEIAHVMMTGSPMRGIVADSGRGLAPAIAQGLRRRTSTAAGREAGSGSNVQFLTVTAAVSHETPHRREFREIGRVDALEIALTSRCPTPLPAQLTFETRPAVRPGRRRGASTAAGPACPRPSPARG